MSALKVELLERATGRADGSITSEPFSREQVTDELEQIRANIHREALAEYTELLELAASTKSKLAQMIRSNEDSARGTEDEVSEATVKLNWK